MSVSSLADRIRNCTRCPLHETATNKVLGTGSVKPDLICIGEAPGEDEDLQGKPFVGKCGEEHLRPMLKKINRPFFLLNTVKCRPTKIEDGKTKNRAPKLFGEVDQCIGFLDEEVDLLKKNNPDALILILGKVPKTATLAKAYTGDYGMGTCKYGRCFILPHPAAMYYNPEMKAEWEKGWKELEKRFTDLGDFAHLHLHTEMSFQDSIIKLDELLPAVKARGQRVVAVTDHYNMAAIPKIMKLGKKEGVLVIPGIEHLLSEVISENVDKAGHITVLAINNQGLENLYRMIGETQFESTQIRGGKLRSPFTFGMFQKYHEGLVVSTACVHGYFNNNRHKLTEKISKAESKNSKAEEIEELKKELERVENRLIFMRDLMSGRFFMEVMPVTVMYPDNVYNAALAEKLGIPLLSTSDVHYLNREDYTVHNTIKANNFHNTIAKHDSIDNEFYLRTASEMLDLEEPQRSIIQKGMESTIKIANMVSFQDIHRGVFIPECKDDCWAMIKKLRDKCPEDPVYKERLEFELGVISDKGFTPYFAIVDGIFSFCQSRNYKAVCRGSVGGSLIAYLLGWHNVDPIKNGIIFERFLSIDRSDPPDVDMDVDSRYRDIIITEFLIPKFGEDKVAFSVLQTTTYANRSAIADVCRTWDIDFRLRDAINPEEMTFPDTFPEEAKLAINKMIGLTKTSSNHPGAVIVSRERIDGIVPIEYREIKDESNKSIDDQRRLQVRVPYEDLEDFGLIKFDLLRQDSLSVLADCEQLTGVKTENIPVDDAEAWDIIKSGQTDGLFQMESDGMRKLIVAIKPNNIRELADTISLWRPGPMDTDLIDTYAQNKGKLKEYCPDTRGVLIYQDQVMIILNKASNNSITMKEANSVRKIISKKLDGKKILELRNKFMMGGGTEDMWNIVSSYQDYGFNKAHATLYATRGYHTAYYKAHHPMEFFVATARYSQKNILALYAYIKTKGLNIEDPCVNHSLELIHYDQGKIYIGLLDIAGIGAKTAEKIIKGRPYKKLEDLNAAGITKAIRLNLAKAGALRDIIPDNARAISAVEGDGSLLIASKEIDVQKMRNEVIKFTQFDLAQSKGEYDMVKTLLERPGAFIVHATILQAEKDGRRLELLISDESGSANISGWIPGDPKELLGENRIFTLSRVGGKTTVFSVDLPGMVRIPKLFGSNSSFKVTGHIVGISEFLIKNGKNRGMAMANILVRNKSGGAHIVVWASQWPRIKNNVKVCLPIEWPVREGKNEGEYSLNIKGE